MAQWQITIPPAIQPITVEQVLDQARIDDIGANRNWITDAIADCTAYAETETQLSLITRTITASYWPERSDMQPQAMPFPPYTCLALYRPPVQAIASVVDGNGNDVSWQPRIVGAVHFVQLNGSTIGPVTIVYTAGYGDTAASVPADIRRAIVAHVSHWYRFRECDTDSIPVGAKYIFDRYRTGSIG